MRELNELSQEISYGKTILHQIAIELELLKDDNFVFQNDFSEYGDSYRIISPKQDTIISVTKNIEDLERAPFRVVKKLKEYEFNIGNLTL